jgi:GDP-mannose pyrophosphatase NudK
LVSAQKDHVRLSDEGRIMENRNPRNIRSREWSSDSSVNGLEDGMLIEACAGLLDNQSPEEAIRREAEEELGVKVRDIRKVLESYMSPGSVTEKLFFFVAEYDSPAAETAGNSEEGEEIEVVELGLDEALDWIDNGRIQDAKTISLLLMAQIKNWFGETRKK